MQTTGKIIEIAYISQQNYAKIIKLSDPKVLVAPLVNYSFPSSKPLIDIILCNEPICAFLSYVHQQRIVKIDLF